MASEAECQVALERLSAALRKFGNKDAIERRTVSCTVTDLDVVFSGSLDGDGFHDISTAPAGKAQIRLQMASDDLVALSKRQLDFPKAWATGRIKVGASLGDLLRLRKFF